MSYSSYGAPPVLGIPAEFSSNPVLQWKGARSSVRVLPCSTGNTIGPSASMLFQIPQSNLGFIVPGSMYLRAKVTVTQASANGNGWAFAGQTNVAPAAGGGFANGTGGGSSLISRYSVLLPGGASQTYQNEHLFRTGVMPHCMSREYLTELRQLEHAGVCRLNSAQVVDTARSKVAYVCIPIPLPLFNAHGAFPLLLCGSGVQLELQTSTALEGFCAIGAAAVTDYQLSDLQLVYQLVETSPEHKQALLAAGPFTMALNDRVYCGGYGTAGGSGRINVGLGLSSLLGTVAVQTLAADWADAAGTGLHNFKPNGLLSYAVFVNSQQVSSISTTDDATCFAELNRCISNCFDTNIVSCIEMLTNTTETSLRSTYGVSNFAIGASTAIHSDASMAVRGVPCDTLSWEIVGGNPAVNQWQATTAAGASTLHVWAFFDSLLIITPDGVCQIKK